MIAKTAVLGLAAILVLAGTQAGVAASDCTEVFIGRSRASDPVDRRASEKAAIEGAIAHWRQQVRHSYGWPYRYWASARNKTVKCTGSPGTRACAVSARPCKQALTS
jgi:hypothetical protein